MHNIRDFSDLHNIRNEKKNHATLIVFAMPYLCQQVIHGLTSRLIMVTQNPQQTKNTHLRVKKLLIDFR